MRALLAVLVIASSFGCRVCQICDEYPAFGGSWQRTNRTSGRVGSVFDPAGAKVAETIQAKPIVQEPWTSESEDKEQDDRPSRSILDDLEEDLPDAPPAPLRLDPTPVSE